MPIQFLVIHLFAGAALATCLVRGRRWANTTLSAPRWWCTLALVGLLAVEWMCFLGLQEPERIAPWRLMAANLTLCPGIALLGAKRPQDRSWQWIVASFWLILSLPPIQQALMARGGGTELHPARAWFTWATILFTAANSVWSRHAVAVLLATAGEWLLFFPLGDADGNGVLDTARLLPLGLIGCAVLLTQVPLLGVQPRSPLDRVWLDFRQAFGLVWTLRVQESINQIARDNHWDLRLEWNGFRKSSDGGTPQLHESETHVLHQAVRNHLRRFVDVRWIDERLSMLTNR